MHYKSEDFKLDLRRCVLSPHQVWVTNGRSTCSPLAETAIGVCGCFSPPFSAPQTKLIFALSADGHVIPDSGNKGKNDCGLLFSGSIWYPDKIVRTGTYHYKVSEKLLSLRTTSELIPLASCHGFMIKLTVCNRTDTAIELDIHPEVKCGIPHIYPLSQWEFMPPQPEECLCEAIPTDDNIWENQSARITLITNHQHPLELSPGGTYTSHYAVVFTKTGEDAPHCDDLSLWAEESADIWIDRLKTASEKLPVLRSSDEELNEYYKRSMISFLVCLWNNEEFAVNPFPATSGIDGGSLCCYPWDLAGYSAHTLVMLSGNDAENVLRAMLKSGIDKHISMALNGTGLGWCSYSYSMWSLVNLFLAITEFCGSGYDLFDDIVRIFIQEENRLPENNHLKDYGRQHNLLEMRTCGYEYYVCSPNAERAWCYDKLADIANVIGKSGFEDWHEKAENIRNAIRTELWDSSAQWFKSVHPDGYSELVYSIQIYDALRLGACTEDMADALITHLHDGAFLGRYGVSSISAEDELHYELNDPDWSGGGAYSGDAPNLAETLWQQGYPDLAYSVLSRHFWMGQMLPYYPQEHYCDKPAVPANKRANIISGAAGIQAVWFGMFGIKPQVDGGLIIDPNPPKKGEFELSGFIYRGVTYRIVLTPEHAQIYADGEMIYTGKAKPVTVK